MITIFLIFLINPAFSQEPGPPKIPEPSPEPKPIKIPDPEPIREPFPEEDASVKIQRLTEENNRLKEQNFSLQKQITELNQIIDNLQSITLEQIKVIMKLVNQLNEAIFEQLFSSEIIL
jgi:hypothetical protein